MRDIVHITYGDLDNKTILESDTGKLEVQTDDTIGRTADGKLTIVGSTELDTKEDKGVVSRVVRLLTNENLDTLIGETIHARQDLDSNILNDMNYPALEAGYFENLYSGADGGNSQRYTTYITDIIFTRRYTVTNGWSSWKEIGSGGGSSYVLPPATETTLGGVIVGSGLNATADGTVNIDMATNVDVIPTVIHAGVVDAKLMIVGNTMHMTFAIEEGTSITALESLLEWDSQYVSLSKVNISSPIFGIDGNAYHCVVDEATSRVYFNEPTNSVVTATSTYVNATIVLTGDFGVPVVTASTLDIIPSLVKAGVVDYSLVVSGNEMHISFVLEEGISLVANESLLEWDDQYIALDKINLPMQILGVDGNFYHAVIDESGYKVYVDGALTTAYSTSVNTNFLLNGDYGVYAREGGSGVSSVNGVLPDANGNVQLVPADIGALSSSGGNATGAISVIKQDSETNSGVWVKNTDSSDYIGFNMDNDFCRIYSQVTTDSGIVGINPFKMDRATGVVSSDVFPILNSSNTFKGSQWVQKTTASEVTAGVNNTDDTDALYTYINDNDVGIHGEANGFGFRVLSVNRVTNAFSSNVFVLQTARLLDSIQTVPASELSQYKEEMQDKIIELEIKLERANTKGYVELVAKIQSQLNILNTKLGEVM